MTASVVDWLLQGDAAVRWQTERDLLELPESDWQKTRGEVATNGWGRQLLENQDPDGKWAGGLYSPKWTSTTYTLLLLRRLGLEPGNEQALAGCERLLDDADWIEGGVSYWKSHKMAERCVNAMVLSLVSYFGYEDARSDGIVELLIGAAYDGGGWNCRDYQGDTHASFHTTISALEGLTEWKRRTGSTAADKVIARGHEFLLEHRMLRSHRTGAVIDEQWKVIHFPPRWHYDVMRGLDHFQDVSAARDDRAAEAMEVIEQHRRPDGMWPKGGTYGGHKFFILEPGRVPSRINTLRALRILNWWNG